MLSNKNDSNDVKVCIHEDRTVDYIKKQKELTSLTESLLREMIRYFDSTVCTLTSFQINVNDIITNVYYNIRYDDLIHLLEESGIEVSIRDLYDEGCLVGA